MGFRSGARLAGRGAAVACVLMTVLRLKRDRRGLSGGLPLTPLTGNLAPGTAWDAQVRLNSAANLRGDYVTRPTAFRSPVHPRSTG